jgi:uncharacterized protein
MLENTFCHIPGIGPKVERDLWDAGLRSWADLAGAAEPPISARRADLLRAGLAESAERLAAGDARYFGRTLPARQNWRMFPSFRHTTAYVDIETTGLGSPGDYITTIVLYDGRTIRHYVHGQNLGDFVRDVADYDLLVTYNGKSFDAPFLRHYLAAPMDQAHIDLRHVLGSLGLRGGLKGCERQLGLDRHDLADVDGYFAVLLWWDYHRNGNARALETLLAYNTLDVVNLATLMHLAYNLKLRETPFLDSHALAVPQAPQIPFRPDRPTIDAIRKRHGLF